MEIFDKNWQKYEDPSGFSETMGMEYVVGAGANYYWLDVASGTVVGTQTDTPPDYQRDFRLLKKR